ncbi:alpha-2-macroglobulin [Trichonephila clavipes]|nr:alpha-2-macroglobulin [Trichonephila clavipes]
MTKIEAVGSGCGLVQIYLGGFPHSGCTCISLVYKQIIISEVDLLLENPLDELGPPVAHIRGKRSNGRLVDIPLCCKQRRMLVANENNKILRADVENNEVNLYFSEISNDGVQISFYVNEIVEVLNPQPGTAKVFDYYTPENSATTSYSFGDPEAAAAGPEDA